MSTTMIGVVYAKGSGAVRRWIVPDSEAQLISSHPTSPGEAMILVDRANIPLADLANPAAVVAFVNLAVQRMTGNPPPVPRCVVVDTETGLVVSAIMADPAIDAHPDGHIVRDDQADTGWCLLTSGALVDPNALVLDANGDQVGVVGIPDGTEVAGSFVAPAGAAAVIDPIAGSVAP